MGTSRAHLLFLRFPEGVFVQLKAGPSTTRRLRLVLLRYRFILVFWDRTQNISKVCLCGLFFPLHL